jgi:hypothetical protein
MDVALRASLEGEIHAAQARLSALGEAVVRRTPLDESFALSAAVRGSGGDAGSSGGSVWLKLESEQVGGCATGRRSGGGEGGGFWDVQSRARSMPRRSRGHSKPVAP